VKRLFLYGFVVCGLLLFCGLPCLAQERHGWPSLTLAGGGYSFSGSSDLNAASLYGVTLGYEINGTSLRNRFGIEAVYRQMETEEKDNDIDIDVSLLRLDCLYLFDPLEKAKNLTPFLTIGVGGRFIDRDSDSDSDFLVAYGFGAKLPLSTALALRADVRHIQVFDDERQDDFECLLGFQYSFGKARQVEEKSKARVDSDGDGVFDGRDKCPNTPMGLNVNQIGCPINPPDMDKDGIPDYLDKCPDSGSVDSVDKNGCLVDSDNDGVPDKFDKCPNNPPGFDVNVDGCMEISN